MEGLEVCRLDWEAYRKGCCFGYACIRRFHRTDCARSRQENGSYSNYTTNLSNEGQIYVRICVAIDSLFRAATDF